MNYRTYIPLLIAWVALLAACSSQPAVYSDEHFASDSPYKMRVDSGVAPACESARRVLLGQGYLPDSVSSESFKARKAVQRDDSPNTFIEMNIVCLPEATGSTVFATGLLTTYALKKSSSSASVGVSAVGSISLPIGQSADSLVKVSEDTIADAAFYRRFFAAVSNRLQELQPAPPQSAVALSPAPEAAEPQSETLSEPPSANPSETPSDMPVLAESEPGVPEAPASPAETVIDTEFTSVPADAIAETPAETPAEAPGEAPTATPPVEHPAIVFVREGPILPADTPATPVDPVASSSPPPVHSGQTEVLPAAAEAAPVAEPAPVPVPAPQTGEEPPPAGGAVFISDPAQWHYDEEE
ncbi:DUF2242 domain-containing protein [Parahaliea mediterranea]|uniref:DUF2242 domain-containing protein n=1 Tax=Parahaliea mediterranea TaxID=651086 RepID=UPI000E2F01DD|nr:DUF2242 domain-containing protein [Parahaliea mediterranea]